MSKPLAYFITFRTFGTWLRGDERGWEDRRNNQFGSPLGERDEALLLKDGQRKKGSAVYLNRAARQVVLKTIREVCEHRGWELLEAEVLAEHVHTVVAGNDSPEHILNSLKAWCTRRLREAGLSGAKAKVWSKYGSTKYLWTETAVDGAREYVRGHDVCTGAA